MRRFKLPKLRHPWAKSAAGFTLVELIVVIAIMGVLAGVGTVGYSGYVKNANKKADQVLVGNIIRAIETGTNSTMFVNDDSFMMGEIAYPVGIITLSSTNSANTITSNTDTRDISGECSFSETMEITYPEKTEVNVGCAHGNLAEIYNLKTVTMAYCTTHSKNLPKPGTEMNGRFNSGHNHASHGSGCDETCSFNYLTHQFTAEQNVAESIRNLYKRTPDGVCELVAQAGRTDADIETIAINDVANSTILAQAIRTAFGENTDLTLKYDGWVNDEGFNYATFYTSAPALMDSIELLSSLLSIGSKISYSTLGLTREYADGEQVLEVVSNTISSTYPTEESWMEQWNSAHSQTWDSWGFGLPGRENYSAARMGYNNGFAAYVKARDKSFDTDGANAKYLTEISEFYSQELLGVGLPGLICTDTFTDSASPLKKNLKNVGDSNGEVFDLLAGYFEDYKGSEACAENGRVLYSVLKTFDATSSIAKDNDNAYGGDMYDYYDSYVNEISAMYGKAQEESSGGIVIVVTVEKGEMNCIVSPSAADPRKS